MTAHRDHRVARTLDFYQRWERPKALDPEIEARLSILEQYLTERRKQRLEFSLQNRVLGVSILVDGVHDLGNASAIMRSCDALGVHRIFLIEDAPKYRMARRSSQGAHKWLDIQAFKDPHRAMAKVKALGYRILGAALDPQSKPLHLIDVCSTPILIAVGNERDGLRPEVLEACDEIFFLPMYGMSQSFNVSVASALALYEVMTRRYGHQPQKPRGDIPPKLLDRFREAFYRKALENSDRILERHLGKVPPSMPVLSEIVAQIMTGEQR